MSKRVLVESNGCVAGSNTPVNQSNPSALDVHPFWLAPKCQFKSNVDGGIHDNMTFSPLRIMNGRIALPSAQIHSTTLVHSCRPGWAWYRIFVSLLTTTYDLWTTPIEKPVSSILYMSSILIFFSLIIFSNSSNHRFKSSSMTLLIHAASIARERAVSNSGYRWIKR